MKKEKIFHVKSSPYLAPCKHGLAGIVLGFVYLFATSMAWAQDLYVNQVIATPAEGVAGDTVNLQARIGNNGPGMALAIQVQWFLSKDQQVTVTDMALDNIETLPDYLYEGQEMVISKQITLPPFMDADPPSYIGLIVDPSQLLLDDYRANNSASTAFTFTGTPPHGFFDPVGDNYLDITHVSAQTNGTNLEVTITFSEPPTTLSGIMAIDLDQNPLTHLKGLSLVGAEALLSFTYSTIGEQSMSLLTGSGTTDLHTMHLDGNQLIYSVPLSLVGYDTDMDLYWAIDHSYGPTTDFDRAPDVGVFATDSSQVLVRHPGDTTISLDVLDPVSGPDEPDFPNVKRMQARVRGDQLEIVLTYDQPVDDLASYPVGDGLFVWIDMDADHRLCTGFVNTEGRPPALGIDYELRLQVDPLAGDVKELLKDEDGDGAPETIPMGLPFNDFFARLSGEKLICRIPLGALGFISGDVALVASNLNTRDIISGTIDRVPDSGAWDLGTGARLLPQTCQTTPLHVGDPADDSIGAFGLDNDELVGIDTCVGDSALLFTLYYKSFKLSNDGATLIYMDTDQDPATGQAVTNMAGDSVIGADYTFRTYWNVDDMKQVTKIYRADPPLVNVKNQLTTITLSDRLYVTIPLECIGNPVGQVDFIVQTASWGGGPILIANDDLPNHGVITIPIVFLPADMDRDGDMDGYDLAEFSTYFAARRPEADINHDQRIDNADLELFASYFGHVLP